MVALSITFTFFAEINIVLDKIKTLCIHHNVEVPFLDMKFQRNAILFHMKGNILDISIQGILGILANM